MGRATVWKSENLNSRYDHLCEFLAESLHLSQVQSVLLMRITMSLVIPTFFSYGEVEVISSIEVLGTCG